LLSRVARSPQTARDALARLEALRPSPHAYRALALTELPGSYVALDRSDRPALFVPAEGHATEPSQRASDVSLSLRVTCDLYLGEGQSVSGNFQVLQCESSDPTTVDTFVLLLDALLDRMRSKRFADGYLATFFRTLAQLFSVRPAPDPAKERQGLWGELTLMRCIGGVSAWASFWHTDPYKRFDLSAAQRRIEIKTTLGEARVHTFSHRQLFTTGGEQVAIASLLLREDPDGLNLRGLIEESRKELSGRPAQLAKLEAAVRSARMSDPLESGPSFDESGTELAWFWAYEVPRFTQPEPPGVSEARYKVDLSSTPEIAGLELADWLDAWGQPPTFSSQRL
jgi:hypothetical protein